jgi:hypothetical protein
MPSWLAITLLLSTSSRGEREGDVRGLHDSGESEDQQPKLCRFLGEPAHRESTWIEKRCCSGDKSGDQACHAEAWKSILLKTDKTHETYDWTARKALDPGTILIPDTGIAFVVKSEKHAIAWLGNDSKTSSPMALASVLKDLLSVRARPQNATTCSTYNSNFGADGYQINRMEMVNCGGGCALTALAIQLMDTVDGNNIVRTPKTKFAPHSDLGRFFLPWSNCSSVHRRRRRAIITQKEEQQGEEKEEEAEEEEEATSAANLVCEGEVQQWHNEGDHWLFFWLISQLLKFITTPNKRLQEKIAAQYSALGFDRHLPVLGVHIRLGDSCNEARHCHNLEYYMPAITRLVKAHGYKAIYLATDSGE